MATKQLLFLVIFSLVSSSFQDVTDNKVDTQEESPLGDIAKQILNEKNLENIGGMVNSFIQSGGAKQVMDGVLQNLASNPNSGQLLQSLGSLLNSGADDSNSKKKGKSNDEINPLDMVTGLLGAMQGGNGGNNQANLLQGLGSLLGGGNNNGGGNNAAALMQGLGALMAATQGNGGKQDDNPASAILNGLGSVLGAAGNGGDGVNILQGLGSLLAAVNSEDDSKPEPKRQADTKPAQSSKPPKKVTLNEKKEKVQGSTTNKSKGANGLLSLASTFLGQGKGLDANFIIENFPLFVKMAKSMSGPELQKYFEPIEDIIYVYDDIKDKRKNEINFRKLAPKILNILKAYQEFVQPYFKGKSKAKSTEDDSFDFSSILNIASSFLNQGGNNNEGPSLMDYLPVIMNTINAFTGPDAEERAMGHSDHSSSIPPILEKLHVYFDNFVNSDMGKQFMDFVTENKALKVFQDEKGNFSYDKFKVLIENHSFRRHWIQQVATKLVEWLRIITDENIQKRYIGMGIPLFNSFLQNSGFPKKTLLDMNRPVKTISNFATFAAKKYLDAEIDAKNYVEPVVLYFTDILKMAKKSASSSKNRELIEKLTDTINMELIEPVTRVNRAYRFIKSQPSCDKYILCVINQENPNDAENFPRLKKALYGGYSLAAGWFLTSHTSTSYWDLFDAITKTEDCQIYKNNACNGFYEEEVKVTTEYIHNEL